MTKPDFETLRGFVRSYGLRHVVDRVAFICEYAAADGESLLYDVDVSNDTICPADTDTAGENLRKPLY